MNEMYEVYMARAFRQWYDRLRDRQAVTLIAARIRRIFFGNLGQIRSVGGTVSELKIDAGPGYRIYFTRRRNVLIILLVGGDKDSQDRDIQKAKEMVEGKTTEELLNAVSLYRR